MKKLYPVLLAILALIATPFANARLSPALMVGASGNGAPPYPVYVPASACNAVYSGGSGGSWSGSDGTTAVQNAVNAAEAVNGEVVLPSTPCLISQAISITSPITIRGQGCFANWGSVANAVWLPSGYPQLLGSGFVQTAAATDVISITGTGLSVNLIRFCGQFGTPYANTGHGVNVNPPAYGAVQNSGILDSHWDGVFIYGHDGNHYGFRIVNSIYNQFDHLRAYGGGGMDFVENATGFLYGNSVTTDFFNIDFLAGTSDGIKCEDLSAPSGELLSLTFIKPQVWMANPTPAVSGTTPPTNTQKLTNFSLTNCLNTVWIAPDMESNTGSGATPPIIQANVIGGALWSGSTAIANNPLSGQSYQNSTGTAVLCTITMTLNPTSIAASTVQIYVASTSNPVASSTEVVNYILPANSIVGQQESWTFQVPSGQYFEVVWTNATFVKNYQIRTSGF